MAPKQPSPHSRLPLVTLGPILVAQTMKQRYLDMAVTAILIAGFVSACASSEKASPTPEDSPSPAVSAAPTLEPSPTPSVAEVKKTAVPNVTGRKLKRAQNILESRGFFVLVRKKTSEEPAGTVLAMSPKPGSELEVGDLVRITVAKPPPAPEPAPEPEPEPAANCHPSYEGACLDPNASDYDCAGGSGNGPEYTGFVTVVGPDVFGLDADGDGAGCE